jgi:manganese efflux pump family protein
MALTTTLTAFGLSMDAVAVSITSGLSARSLRWTDALKMALLFGVFQAAMPGLGYAAGNAFQAWIGAVDHWVAFIVLGAIGGKMIIESIRQRDSAGAAPSSFETRKLLVLAVATSIDALAVGLTLSLLGNSLVVAMFIFGLTTFTLCLPAVWLGARLGAKSARWAEIGGGIILISIGLKILIEHLFFGA